MIKLKEASVHGRFQPLHNQHLEYLLAAKEKCDFLWIGITQFDIKHLQGCPKNRHREKHENNPLTYFERISIIKNALINFEIDPYEFTFIPFPIDRPEVLHDFLPISIPIFTTICDEWNLYKINLLKNSGYEVISLFNRNGSVIRGESIRNDIIIGNERWRNQVPPSSEIAIDNLKIRERLIK